MYVSEKEGYPWVSETRVTDREKLTLLRGKGSE